MLIKLKHFFLALLLGVCFSVFAESFTGLFTPNSTAFAAPPASAFGELPVAYDAAVSPDGKNIAVVVNVNGEYGIYVQSRNDAGTPQYIRLGEGVKPGFIKWANDQRWVTSIKRQDTYRNIPFTSSYLYSADIVTQESGLVVEPRGMFRQNNSRVIDWLEDDPDHILMVYSDEEFDPYPDIKRVNVTTGRDRTVKRGKNGIEYWISDGDGTPRIGAGQTDGGDKKMIIYNSRKERWDRSDDYPGIDPETNIYGILKDGTELVIADYQGKDTLGLYIYNLEEKKITRTLFHNEEYDALGVVLSKDGETVIGARYIADKDKIELLAEHGTLVDRLRAKFTDYTVDFVDQTEDGKTVLVKMSAAYDPGGLYLYNFKDEMPSRISRMYNEIVPDDLGNVSSVHYTARDGERIPAFVTLPPVIKTSDQLKNLPFIVLPHGGPYSRDANEFDYFAQFFATRGYGVLQMNFRGSEGYGKRFSDAGRSNWVVMQEDVEDGTRWLMEKGYADPEKTCIAGWSYGGYAALMGVATDPELYRCAIAMAALTDIDEAKDDFKKYRGGKHAAKEFFGEAFEDKDLRRANSPVNVAENIQVPVFLAHGDKDEQVQFDQFERMKKALEKADVEATYLEFEDENHFLSVQKNREEFFVEMEKFLLKVNGPSEYMIP